MVYGILEKQKVRKRERDLRLQIFVLWTKVKVLQTIISIFYIIYKELNYIKKGGENIESF